MACTQQNVLRFTAVRHAENNWLEKPCKVCLLQRDEEVHRPRPGTVVLGEMGCCQKLNELSYKLPASGVLTSFRTSNRFVLPKCNYWCFADKMEE